MTNAKLVDFLKEVQVLVFVQDVWYSIGDSLQWENHCRETQCGLWITLLKIYEHIWWKIDSLPCLAWLSQWSHSSSDFSWLFPFFMGLLNCSDISYSDISCNTHWGTTMWFEDPRSVWWPEALRVLKLTKTYRIHLHLICHKFGPFTSEPSSSYKRLTNPSPCLRISSSHRLHLLNLMRVAKTL